VKLAGKACLALVAASALACAGAASADCNLAEIAEFHVDPNRPSPVADGEINGHPVKILFDTGASTSMVPVAEARRLNLSTHRISGARMYGIGGDTAVYDAVVGELKIGTFKTNNLHLVAAGDQDAKSDVSLILGNDFFSRTDVEFDLREGVVRLFEPRDCSPPQLVYWNQAYSQATILPSERDTPKTQTMTAINGKPVLAEFDTGAYVSSIDETAAQAAGVARPQGDAGQAVHGLGPRTEQSWVAHFDSLAVGDEKLSNIHLQVMNFVSGMTQTRTGMLLPYQLGSTPYLFIGADFFHAHRVFIDNKDHLILFSYEGGPVFRAPEASAAAASR
jgi:predicted aspartyl protease